MIAESLTTENPDIQLVQPNIERDSRLGLAWLQGKAGKRTLMLMGVPEARIAAPTLEQERERVNGFIHNESQLNWMIELEGTIVGSIWVDLEKYDYLPSPSVHIMIGSPEARGRGVGRMATKSVVGYLSSIGYDHIYSRHLTTNTVAARILSDIGFKPLEKSYYDQDGLNWQNVVLSSQEVKQAYAKIDINKNLSLKQLQPSQAEILFDLTSNNQQYLGEYLNWVNKVRSIDDSRRHIEETITSRAMGSSYTYGIEYDGSIVGNISLRNIKDSINPPEIGYWIAQNFSGKGIVTKAVAALTELGLKTLNLNKIIIRADPKNIASNKVAEKAGYQLTGQQADGDEVLNVWQILHR